MGEVAGIKDEGKNSEEEDRERGGHTHMEASRQGQLLYSVLCTYWVYGGMDICMNGKGTMQHD